MCQPNRCLDVEWGDNVIGFIEKNVHIFTVCLRASRRCTPLFDILQISYITRRISISDHTNRIIPDKYLNVFESVVNDPWTVFLFEQAKWSVYGNDIQRLHVSGNYNIMFYSM